MTNQSLIKPQGATHAEQDGTFWMNLNGAWYHYNPHFKKWATYVGKVNHSFLNKLFELGA
ncbi:hypothetical protein MMO38_06600 [Acinetobacter sp. NIPH 1852]|uniref:hypothetical protein n=1 Tax=Acinetobacter sp. NIPH 1852 TaxID=2923428 RepID=UPI001F4A67F6|nr:hypothetical protein [Acinetobacter sp. NIPH 1852]MCH7307809.1 hypothetical protein [Acinetobacter sp. NIPH 1852]